MVVLAVTLLAGLGAEDAVRAQDHDIVVTSALDDVGPDAPVCPSITLCTLRKAIEIANADPGGGPISIGFDPDVFPANEPATITLVGTSLPPVERSEVAIDGREVGVFLDGTGLEPGGDVVGLVLAGEDTAVVGLAIRGFSAACITLAGAGSSAGGSAIDDSRNSLDDCGTGIFVSGEGARVHGNLIGLDPADPDNPVMATGIAVAADNVLVGHADPFPGAASVVGNVTTGIRVGLAAGNPISGVRIESNLFGVQLGQEPQPAPVETAILLDHPSSGTTVTDNEVRNAATGISVADDLEGVSIVGNNLRGNRYDTLSGLAIDLKGDGIRNANDAGDADDGPNGMRNSPGFTRVTQAQITGSACPGCTVDLYVAFHVPGGNGDHPRTPVLNGSVTADALGDFAFTSPAVSPGEWLMAIATDGDGDTSEFSPAVRVGAGAVQCGNLQLIPGWNVVGYFGQPMILDDDFPGPAVAAVHRLVDGSRDYVSWFRSGGAGLTSLATGEPYWFFAETPAALAGGFSLTSALPVQLEEGWNDFVYVGASADVRDALGSIEGKWDALYRYQNDGDRERWLAYGSPEAPDYVHGFDNAISCVAYRIRMTEPGTLVPLQP